MLVVLAGALLLFQIGKVQTFVAQQIVRQISTSLQTDVKVEEVKIRFINQFQFRNVFIEDLNKDTLFFADNINVNVRKYSVDKRQLYFNHVKFVNATVNFYTDSSDEINLQFIVDAIKANSKKDTLKNKKPFDIFIRKINLRDSRFKFNSYKALKPIDGKINFADMDFQNLNIQVNDFDINSDTVNFYIKRLSFTDKSGFEMNRLTGDFNLSSQHIVLANAYMRSFQSIIYARKLKLNFANYQQFSNGRFFENVKMDYDLEKVYGHTDDVSYIVPAFSELDNYFSLQGRVYGTLNNLKASNLALEYSKNTVYNGNFSISGLPDIEQTFMYFKINNITTISSELSKIINGFTHKDIQIPFLSDDLGIISFRGNYSGFVNDFVAYGKLNTAAGDLMSDISLKPDSVATIAFKGAVSSNNLNPSFLLKSNVINNVAFETVTEGVIDKNSKVNVQVNGLVHELEFNNYNYKNINLKGNLQNDKFDGDITVKDPNLELDFSGKIEFDDENAVFDFVADVQKANLHKLNIDKKDYRSQATFIINANGEGRNLNEFKGEIKVLNSFFSRTDKQLQLYNCNLIAEKSRSVNTLSLNSDFIDAEIYGKYNFSTLGASFLRLMQEIIPSINPDSTVNNGRDENNFHYNVNFKRTREITDYFLPALNIADNTSLSGNYAPDSNYYFTSLISDKIGYNAISAEGMNLNTTIEDSTINLSVGNKKFKVGNNITLDNFSFDLKGKNDSIMLSAIWSNWDSALYKGRFYAGFYFEEQEQKVLPQLKIEIKPSELIVKDTIWNISQSSVVIDTNSIAVNNVIISHNDQKITLEGVISNNSDDKITLTSQSFSLQNINMFTKSKKFKLGGFLSGKAVLSNIYDNPLFLSNLHINNLELNDYDIGETDLSSEWNNENERMEIELVSERGMLETLNLEADYYPSSDAIDAVFELNKFRLNVFNAFFENVFSDINGIGTGELEMSGTLHQPIVDGEISLNKSSFVIDYLRTRYNFSDKVVVSNNNFIFSNVKIYDQYGKFSVLNGSIQNNYFKNLNFNLNIESDNFLFLNTTFEDNSDFYGKAFASGVIKITGSPDNVNLDIAAKTNSNTVFYIPLNTTTNIGKYNFVKFTNADNTGYDANVDYNVNLSGLQMRIDLEVTPDAEAQIIFDSKVGDILKGRGTGNIILEINTLGKFNMYGDFIIDGGDYLFTLGNILNKKFNIEKGGVISWNGDPIDADIDLKAIYRTKVSGESLPEAESIDKRIPIDCELYLTDKLLNPNIQFGISTPATEPEIRTAVQDVVSNKAELDKQFMFLLVVNSFMVENAQGTGTETYLESSGKTTTFEMLSNQLSHYLSQWSEDFDVGVNYRMGDRITNDELEVALSTKVLNDRVSISGNLDVGGNEYGATENTSNIVGEFDLDVKLSKSDKLHLKAYNKAHDNIERSSEYRYGVGISYKEEFDSWQALLKRYFGLNKRDTLNINN